MEIRTLSKTFGIWGQDINKIATEVMVHGVDEVMRSPGTVIVTIYQIFLGFFFQLPRKEIGHVLETANFSLNVSAG